MTVRQTMLGVTATIALAACEGYATRDEASETATTIVQAASASPIRVCSWNMRRLGHDFDDRPKDVTVAAKIIESHCDLLAVQEVMQKGGGKTPGHSALLEALGNDWSGVITDAPRPNTTSSSSELYAFYFRRAEVAVCPKWEGARFVSDAKDAFLREPSWSCFAIPGRERELLLANYHAIYGSIVERRREVTLLDDDLDEDGVDNDVMTEVRASRPHEVDVIVLGDFNLTTNDLANVLPRFVDLTKGTGSTLNLRDGVTKNLFDHALVAEDDADSLGATSAVVLDVRAYASDDTFYRSVSDHLPIRFELARSSQQPPSP